MRDRRRRRGFEQAGAVPARLLGLPARRARELTLLQGWEHVAGRTLSRNVHALRVDRGVLRIEASDRSWYEAVEPLLPQLAARLAVEQPRLGIKKYRLGLAGVAELPEALPVPEFIPAVSGGRGDGDTPPRRARTPREGHRPPDVRAEDLTRRLESLARRHGERGRAQKA